MITECEIVNKLKTTGNETINMILDNCIMFILPY